MIHHCADGHEPGWDRSDDSPLPGMEPQVAVAFDKPYPSPHGTTADAVIDYLVESERPFAGVLVRRGTHAPAGDDRLVDRTDEHPAT